MPDLGRTSVNTHDFSGFFPQIEGSRRYRSMFDEPRLMAGRLRDDVWVVLSIGSRCCWNGLKHRVISGRCPSRAFAMKALISRDKYWPHTMPVLMPRLNNMFSMLFEYDGARCQRA
jgi:hypothetical protein